MSPSLGNSKTNGASYFFQGWSLISLPGIRRFVIMPLLINFLLLGSAFYWCYSRLGEWIPRLMHAVPHWLQWLDYLLWPLAIISVLLFFSYFFSTVANWIAAPFCGLLAEQLEAQLTGMPAPESSLLSVINDLPRVIKREWQKLTYYLPRALLLLALYLLPGIGQTIIPILWFLFAAWMLSIQYCDYAFDNHKVNFGIMRSALGQEKWQQLQFGALVNIATMIPIINLVIMPVAVCGATAMWVDRYRHLANTDHAK